MSYRPVQRGLLGRSVVVWGLLPHTTYTFSIQALNGVSQQSGKAPNSDSVNITTSHDGRRHKLGWTEGGKERERERERDGGEREREG